jgi:PilZ domain
MSARKTADVSLSSFATTATQCLTLPSEAVRVSKNGIEFHSREAFQPWTEMTLSVQKPGETKKINCTGVIVACNRNRYEGYSISMLFTNLSRQSQNLLLGRS